MTRRSRSLLPALVAVIATVICFGFLTFVPVGCSPASPPAPIPVYVPDAAPTVPCQDACTAMTAVCGPQRDVCVQTMSQIDGAQPIASPGGHRLTCMAVALATTKPAMRALGIPCP